MLLQHNNTVEVNMEAFGLRIKIHRRTKKKLSEATKSANKIYGDMVLLILAKIVQRTVYAVQCTAVCTQHKY